MCLTAKIKLNETGNQKNRLQQDVRKQEANRIHQTNASRSECIKDLGAYLKRNNLIDQGRLKNVGGPGLGKIGAP